MATITPTMDQRQIIDCTVFQIGDTVQDQSGKIGVIITAPGMIPSPVPISPMTENVDVRWMDGTQSVVLISTLSRV